MLIDRRRFLQGSGAAAVIGATGLPGCGDNAGPGAFAAAVFDADTDRALVWVGGRPGAVADLVATDDTGAVRSRASVELGDAGTGAVELTGLVAGARHHVTITGGARYTFVTAPAADDPRPVRIAWSGDLDLDPQFASEILDVVRGAEPDLFVSLGDWPYADNAPGAVTLAEYRDRHRIARTDPGTQDLLRATSVRAIYDDHEIRNDWDPSTHAEEPQRHVDGMQAWDEYFPVRGAAAGVRYRSWRWGAHVECFLLDCRRYRSAKGAPDDAAKTMLGATQLAWLTAGLAASTARWKLVFTTVPLDFGSTDEHWAAYTTERTRMCDAIVAAGVTGILFLAADQHWFASHRHAHGIRELQAGPLARGLPVLPSEAPGVLARVSAYNAGVLDLDGTVIRARCLDGAGVVRYEEVLTLAELTPTKT